MATESGASIAISDVLIPDEKFDILKRAQSEVDDIQKKFDNHILTDGERYNKVIDVWTHATTVMAMTMMGTLKKIVKDLILFT